MPTSPRPQRLLAALPPGKVLFRLSFPSKAGPVCHQQLRVSVPRSSASPRSRWMLLPSSKCGRDQPADRSRRIASDQRWRPRLQADTSGFSRLRQEQDESRKGRLSASPPWPAPNGRHRLDSAEERGFCFEKVREIQKEERKSMMLLILLPCYGWPRCFCTNGGVLILEAQNAVSVLAF